MTADIIPSLLKSIDNYPFCVIQVDDVFITGMAADLATNPNIPRTRSQLIDFTHCEGVCRLFKTPVLYDCKTVEQYNIFWSNWKNSTYEKCFPGIPISTTLKTTRNVMKPKMSSIQKIYMKIQKTDQIQDSSNELILILVVIIIVLLLKRWKKVLKIKFF